MRRAVRDESYEVCEALEHGIESACADPQPVEESLHGAIYSVDLMTLTTLSHTDQTVGTRHRFLEITNRQRSGLRGGRR
jgi:hypothetical protein